MNDPTTIEAIQYELSMEPLSEYRPKRLPVKINTGAVGNFKEFYRQNLQSAPGKITVGKVEITTTPEVMAVLRALLHTGCCTIEARSTACREIFLRACSAGRYIDTQVLLSTFVENSPNLFVPVLQQAIEDVLL